MILKSELLKHMLYDCNYKKLPVYWLVVCEPDFYGYSVLKKNPILREIPLSDWMVVASSLALVYQVLILFLGLLIRLLLVWSSSYLRWISYSWCILIHSDHESCGFVSQACKARYPGFCSPLNHRAMFSSNLPLCDLSMRTLFFWVPNM